MASSSSPHTWRYNVFTSFRVPDVRKSFLSHLRKEFNRYGITMAPEPTQGIRESIISIRESRISIIVLSKNFASSAWCLDELLEILKCKEEMGHIVMPIFYGVDPFDVRKQTGYFWRTFEQFCAGITEEKRQRWGQALKYVSNIPGEVSQNWDNESKMIEKIARDVSNILFTGTKSRYSTGMSYLVVINLLVEIASAVADQLSSIHKHYFARISLLLSFLSVVISILDLSHKIRAHKDRFLCNWPIPWFYYNGDNKIFGSFADTVFLFCAVGQLIVSTINYSFIERSRDCPIKVSLLPLFFAIGMVISKFMGTQPIPRTF